MRYLMIMLMLFTLPAWAAADYAREKKWADEITPSIVVGDPTELGPVQGHRFLAIYTEAPQPKAAVIVVHGLGVHPDWNLIGGLRSGLAERGYTTLSVQMPVLAVEAKSKAYAGTLDEAAERLQAAAEFLQSKGYKKIALVSHSLGSRMSLQYMTRYPAAPVQAWVAIGMGGKQGYGGVRIPVLDLYGDNDLPAVMKSARMRASTLKAKESRQIMAAGSNHFFNNRDAELVKIVQEYLDNTLPAQP